MNQSIGFSGSISIHALREEGDLCKAGLLRTGQRISIHALREEGDVVAVNNITKIQNFYPRPPRGGRHETGRFESVEPEISIHALREEGDEHKLQ